MNVLTLISPNLQLTSATVDKLVKGKLNVSKIEWLAKDEACDIYFEGSKDINIDAPGLDYFIQNSENRRKKMLVSDMDSTIITIECIDEIADFAGVKDKVSHITELAMNGELDFAGALKERVKLLKGLPVSTLEKVYDERVEFMGGAKELVSTMRKHSAFCLLVSGGFTYFTNRVREEIGFHEDHANLLEIANGKLTGEVIEPILDKDSKLKSLETKAKEFGISADEVLAVGDGANDLPMLLKAGLGVAYHAKAKVKAATKAKIDVCDLKALLYAQGYHKEEFTGR